MFSLSIKVFHLFLLQACHGHDRMLVGFTPTCAISTYNH